MVCTKEFVFLQINRGMVNFKNEQKKKTYPNEKQYKNDILCKFIHYYH